MLLAAPGAVGTGPNEVLVVPDGDVVCTVVFPVLLPATRWVAVELVTPALAVEVTVVPPPPCVTLTVTCGPVTDVVVDPIEPLAPVLAPLLEPLFTALAIVLAVDAVSAGFELWPVEARTLVVAVVAMVLTAEVAPAPFEA